MATIDVKDASGNTVPIEKPIAPGRKSAALSRPVVLSDEDSTALAALATQTTAAAILAKIIASPATEGKQDTGNTSLASIITLLTTQAGYLDGLEALAAAATPAGANLIGRAVADASAAAGGIAATSRIVSAAASTNATSAKASAGRLYAIQGFNASASVRYLKLYNKASAPTVGTDTPVKTLALPPSCGFAFDFPLGYSFAAGIAYAMTTGSADADTGALTAADVLGLNMDYI